VSETPVHLFVSGATGRLGRAITRLAGQSANLVFVGGTARQAHAAAGVVAQTDVDPRLNGADVVIDVSSPDFMAAFIRQHGEALSGRALVVGTTGLAAAEQAALDDLAERVAVLVAPNFSPGLNLLLDLVRRAAAALPSGAFDIEIVEAHHRAKVDSPSGTALALAQAVAEARDVSLEQVRRDGRSGRTGERPPSEIGLHAVRGGGVIGEHRVLLLGERERIELVHSAGDRDVFAACALDAARWIVGRPPGHYTMADVLGTGDPA
jgi:4-hydroxy-tetrahydrodipicolinate reductase